MDDFCRSLIRDTPMSVLLNMRTLAKAADIGSPFNVLSLVPDIANPSAENGYSPLWSVFVVGDVQAKRLTSYADVASIAKPAGFVVSCPAIAFDAGGGQ